MLTAQQLKTLEKACDFWEGDRARSGLSLPLASILTKADPHDLLQELLYGKSVSLSYCGGLKAPIVVDRAPSEGLYFMVVSYAFTHCNVQAPRELTEVKGYLGRDLDIPLKQVEEWNIGPMLAAITTSQLLDGVCGIEFDHKYQDWKDLILDRDVERLIEFIGLERVGLPDGVNKKGEIVFVTPTEMPKFEGLWMQQCKHTCVNLNNSRVSAMLNALNKIECILRAAEYDDHYDYGDVVEDIYAAIRIPKV